MITVTHLSGKTIYYCFLSDETTAKWDSEAEYPLQIRHQFTFFHIFAWSYIQRYTKEQAYKLFVFLEDHHD